MKAGTIFLIFKDVIQDLQDNGMITPTGDFNFPPKVSPYEILASKLNAQIVSHGINEPKQIQAIINIIPLVLMLAGIE